VTRCTFDAGGDPTGCTNDTMAVSATWTGQGPISRGKEYVDWIVQPGGFTYVDRGSGTTRLASATPQSEDRRSAPASCSSQTLASRTT